MQVGIRWERDDDMKTMWRHTYEISNGKASFTRSESFDAAGYREELKKYQKRKQVKPLSATQIAKGAASLAKGERELRKPVEKRAVPLEVVAERQRICESCENYDFGRCAKKTGCGCFLHSAVRNAGKTCPIGKWPAIG